MNNARVLEHFNLIYSALRLCIIIINIVILTIYPKIHKLLLLSFRFFHLFTVYITLCYFLHLRISTSGHFPSAQRTSFRISFGDIDSWLLLV